jgi:tetratricopeptide (TPR) repeat protein
MRVHAQHRSDECERLCTQADVARDAGSLARADELIDRALKKSPRDRDVRRQLAESLWNVGRQRESLDILTQLALDHPRDVSLATLLAERLEELGRLDEALERLQPALSADPTAVAALELKARIEMAQGRHDDALATYQRLAQLEPSQVQALLEMGTIHVRRGQSDRAAPLFRSILIHPRATKDQLAQARWQLGVAYAQSERWADAAVQLALAAPDREMSADDWHNVAYAQYRSGDLAAAQVSLSHALGLEPGHPLASKLTAVVMHASKSNEPLVPAAYERASATQDESRL